MNQEAPHPLTIGQSISKCKDEIRSILRRIKETFEPCSQRTIEAFTANLIEDLKSVFDEFVAEAVPEQIVQNTMAENENDSDATIDLDSESEDEAQIENEKRDEDTIILNKNMQVENTESAIPDNTQLQRMTNIQRLRIVIDRTEVPSHLNNSLVRRKKQTKQMRKRPKHFACKICQKKFANGQHSVYHRKNHLEQCPNLCKICSRSFSNSCEEVDHEMICTKHRYECYVCKLIVNSRSYLLKHMQMHSH